MLVFRVTVFAALKKSWLLILAQQKPAIFPTFRYKVTTSPTFEDSDERPALIQNAKLRFIDNFAATNRSTDAPYGRNERQIPVDRGEALMLTIQKVVFF